MIRLEVHFGITLSPDPVSTSIVRVADESWIWGQAISASVPFGLTRREEFGQKEIMKWTTLTFKELAAQRTLRMDAKYWIKKKLRAASSKPQASSGKQRLTCKWK